MRASHVHVPRLAAMVAVTAAVLGALLLLFPMTSSAVSDVQPPMVSDRMSAEQSSDSTTYTLYFRWSMVGWMGASGTDIMEALENNSSPDGDLSDRVTAVYTWNGDEQRWEAFFPAFVNLPGGNDFTTFTRLTAYWMAITPGSTATWTP